MGLLIGAVTVNPDGTHSGTGLAGLLMDRLVAADKTGAFNPVNTWANVVTNKEELANFVTAIADAIVTHVLTAVVNCSVTIPAGVSGAGLQKTPSPLNPDVATNGPDTPKTITGTGTLG